MFVASDDGTVACLQAGSGAVVWRYRPDIPRERLVGNEQIVSRWPARSGVLVDGSRAYTTFGMWSPEGIVVACLDARTGEEIWTNDNSGTYYMTQPHYEAMGGVSPQGYLTLDGDILIVPCGRAAPAFFDARTGKFLYHESQGLFPGGAWTMTHAGLTFVACEYLKKPNPVLPAGPEADISNEASLFAFRTDTREEVFHLNGALRGVSTDDGILTLIGPGNLLSVSLDAVIEAAPDHYKAKMGSSEGHMVPAADHLRWQVPVDRVFSLVQAGGTLICGGRGTLTCRDAGTGKKTWETTLNGDVRDLIVTEQGHVLASTTAGEIRCYRTAPAKRPDTVRPEHTEIRPSPAEARRVRQVLASVGAPEGYALFLGKADAGLLAELGRQSTAVWHWGRRELSGAHLRTRLADAGLYGTRIVIHDLPRGPLPYADTLFNAVVFDVRTRAELETVAAEDLRRVVRPCGGAALVACPESLRPAVRAWLQAHDGAASTWDRVENGFRLERGPLPGAGAWTHQYADAGKSGATQDERVRLPLKVLWFGGFGPADAVSRHYRGPAPLAIDGRVFVAGNEQLHAVDAYNGRILWERELPGIGRWPMPYRAGSIAADHEAVYAAHEAFCLRIDPATGDTLGTYRPPEGWREAVDDLPARGFTPGKKRNIPNEPIWEYLAVTEGLVLGTVGLPNVRPSWWSHAHPASGLLFALDKRTGDVRWVYEPRTAIDSNAVAVSGNRVFVLDGLAPVDLLTRPRKGQKAKSRRRYSVSGTENGHILLALDLETGNERWRTTDLNPRQNSVYAAHGVVLATIPTWHGLRAVNEGPELTVFDATDGTKLWTRADRGTHPVILKDRVYLHYPFDLRTGTPLEAPEPITGAASRIPSWVPGGCGRPAACPNLMMKRSGSLGFTDLRDQGALYHYPNLRASCWINMIPACGLVIIPEGSSSCPCAYNYKTSIALMPAERHNHWGLFQRRRRPADARVEQLRLNLGAPGDRADERGEIWYAFPRPSTDGPRGAGGMGRVPSAQPPAQLIPDTSKTKTVRRNPDWIKIRGADRPWIYSCGLSGPVRLHATLGPEEAEPAPYKVVLHFCDLNAPPETGGFTATVQGQTVKIEAPASRGHTDEHHAIKKILTVRAGSGLSVEMRTDRAKGPCLSAVEITRK